MSEIESETEESSNEKFRKFKQAENLELKKTLILIRNDLIVVVGIIASLTAVSLLLDQANGYAHITVPFTYLFHLFHEAVSLSLYILLGLRTIDHFLSGSIGRLARRLANRILGEGA